jgi:signal transduction histidine kinase
VQTKRRWLSPGDDPLVRAVARLPARVHVKLLVAFVGTALLVVGVSLLGLRLLGQSNERVETLGTLQERAFAYGKLRSDALHVRLLLSDNVAGDFHKSIGADELTERSAAGTLAVDQAIASAVTEIPSTTFPDILGFVPPPEDESFLRRIRARAQELSKVMQKIIRVAPGVDPTPLRTRSERLAVDLNQLATELANASAARSDIVIAQNARAYTSSRNLFVGVAAGAIVLALLLGFVLSWSLIGPIQRINFRLAAIASGDFSGHVDVANRDELGALAINVNRMNDELQRLYKEVETASKHKSEFLANMSHELRTPLNAIIGFSQVLREGISGEVNAKQQEYLDDILTSANHLLALINDVLDLSKVEAGQVELQVAPFSLQDALERGVSMVREQATHDGVQVVLHANGKLDVVVGDERRIRQVIFNLLSNAVKFAPAGGQVDINATRSNGEVTVSVADTGPGIAAQDLDRIFEQFQQTEVGASQPEGTGLGLALSKRFVEMHGGRIWCESVLGKGSTFVFTLPAGKA